MTIFRVEKYVVKPEKQREYMTIMKKWAGYLNSNKKTCKELRSWKLFSQSIGGNVGEYIEMWELENLADYEAFMHRIFHGQNESVRKIVLEFTACTVPGTYLLAYGTLSCKENISPHGTTIIVFLMKSFRLPLPS